MTFKNVDHWLIKCAFNLTLKKQNGQRMFFKDMFEKTFVVES